MEPGLLQTILLILLYIAVIVIAAAGVLYWWEKKKKKAADPSQEPREMVALSTPPVPPNPPASPSTQRFQGVTQPLARLFGGKTTLAPGDPFFELKAEVHHKVSSEEAQRLQIRHEEEARQNHLANFYRGYQALIDQHTILVRTILNQFGELVWGTRGYQVYEGNNIFGDFVPKVPAGKQGGHLEGSLTRQGRWFVRGDRDRHPRTYFIEIEPNEYGAFTRFRVGLFKTVQEPVFGGGVRNLYQFYYHSIPTQGEDLERRLRAALSLSYKWTERDFANMFELDPDQRTKNYAYEYTYKQVERPIDPKKKNGLKEKVWNFSLIPDHVEYGKTIEGEMKKRRAPKEAELGKH